MQAVCASILSQVIYGRPIYMETLTKDVGLMTCGASADNYESRAWI